MPIDMTEATRLTREGRLDEAMALLRGGPVRPSGLIDMTPTGPGGAWEAPEAGPGLGAARVPPALRGLLRRGAPAGARPVQVPPGARWEARAHRGPEGSRAYKLYVPAPRPGPLPLLVMLHGCTQDPDDFARGTRMNALAEEMGFLVAYPEQTQAANAQRCWNWFNPADQGRGGEPLLIAGIARDVVRDEATDPSRVYVAGLSAGGAQAAIMGRAFPEVFAGVGVHSGLACGAARDLPSALQAMRSGGAPGRGRPMPTIVFHGDRDATVHPVNGDEVAAQARPEGRGAERAETTRGEAPGGLAFTRTTHADAAGRPVLERWAVHGAGHAWSGGDPSGSHTEPRGPDASRAMATFLLRHRLARP